MNEAATRPEKVSIEPANLFSYYGNIEEINDFSICVQPIINEAAVNPSQVTLLEGMYTNYKLRKV